MIYQVGTRVFLGSLVININVHFYSFYNVSNIKYLAINVQILFILRDTNVPVVPKCQSFSLIAWNIACVTIAFTCINIYARY